MCNACELSFDALNFKVIRCVLSPLQVSTNKNCELSYLTFDYKIYVCRCVFLSNDESKLNMSPVSSEPPQLRRDSENSSPDCSPRLPINVVVTNHGPPFSCLQRLQSSCLTYTWHSCCPRLQLSTASPVLFRPLLVCLLENDDEAPKKP